ncbi:MAG: OmpH family outer membrane protein [Gammaproteobacteria bacterium]
MRFAYRMLLVVAAAGLLLGAGTLQAADLKIGVVNMQALMKDSPQAKAAEAEMQRKFGSRRSALLAQGNKVKALQEQINRNGSVMSATQLQNLQNQMDADQQDLSRKENDFQADLNQWQNQKLGAIQEIVVKEVQTFAKAHNYNLIVGLGIVYADGTVDVTDQVLAQLQKDYKAPAPAPAAATGGN